MSGLLRAILDEWKLVFKAPSLLVILLATPLIYGGLISWLYQANQPVERPAVVVDADGSALSRELLLSFEATQGLTVIERAETLERGFALLDAQQAELLIYLPPGLSAQLKRGEQGTLKVYADTANMLTYAVGYPAVGAALQAKNGELGALALSRAGVSKASRRVPPITIGERLLYNPSAAYGDFLVPGVLLVVLQQVVLLGLAFSAGLRRERDPSYSPTFSGLAGAGLAQLGFYAVGAAVLVYGVFPRFGWPVVSPKALFGVFVAFAAATVPLGMVAGRLVKDRYAAFQVLVFLSTPLFMLSGFAWPKAAMPTWVAFISGLFPATPALEALRLAAFKTASLADLRPALLSMAGLSLVYLVLAALLGLKKVRTT